LAVPYATRHLWYSAGEWYSPGTSDASARIGNRGYPWTNRHAVRHIPRPAADASLKSEALKSRRAGDP
jgi:hypothetical protein